MTTDEEREAAVTGVVIFLFIYFEDSAGFQLLLFYASVAGIGGSDASDNGIGGTQTLHFEMRTRLSRQPGIYLDMEGTYSVRLYESCWSAGQVSGYLL